MYDREDCFYQIPGVVDPYVLQELAVIIQNDEPWLQSYAFDAKLVDKDLMVKDWFYKWLYEQREFDAGILRIAPSTCYKWHTDCERNVTINVLLNGVHNSHAYFELSGDGTVSNIVELSYERRTRYLFNCAIQHEVINLDVLPRYVLTIQFKQPVTFHELLEQVRK